MALMKRIWNLEGHAGKLFSGHDRATVLLHSLQLSDRTGSMQN